LIDLWRKAITETGTFHCVSGCLIASEGVLLQRADEFKAALGLSHLASGDGGTLLPTGLRHRAEASHRNAPSFVLSAVVSCDRVKLLYRCLSL